MTRRERLEAKLEKREEWAGKAAARSEQRFGAASQIADQIPFGQPILVGHHSERHARRDAERIHNNMDKGCEEAKLADHHRAKASGLAAQLDRSVFSDDEDAIAQLEERAAASEKEAEKINAINKAWRKSKGDVAALVASGVVSEKLAAKIVETMRLCPYLKTPLSATSDRASARRDRERVEEIKRRQARTAEAEAAGGVVVKIGKDTCGGEYATVTFAERPDYSVITALKAANFFWSGGSWHGDRAKLPACVLELAGLEASAPPMVTTPSCESCGLELCACHRGSTCDKSHDPLTCSCAQCVAHKDCPGNGCGGCADLQPQRVA